MCELGSSLCTYSASFLLIMTCEVRGALEDPFLSLVVLQHSTVKSTTSTFLLQDNVFLLSLASEIHLFATRWGYKLQDAWGLAGKCWRLKDKQIKMVKSEGLVGSEG